jgi:hypothetical protein
VRHPEGAGPRVCCEDFLARKRCIHLDTSTQFTRCTLLRDLVFAAQLYKPRPCGGPYVAAGESAQRSLPKK